MAGGLAGQVLGVAVGGAVAAAYGWRTAFLAIGIGGLVLAITYPWLVRESRLSTEPDVDHDQVARPSFRALFAGRMLNCTYVGSGLQLFVAGALPAWLPTYFVRYYDLPLKDAASLAGLFLAVAGVGMVICGMISDRVVHGSRRRAVLSAFYCLGCALMLTAALWFGPGIPQLVLLGAAMFLAAATAGPAGAMVANLTPAALHGTAFAILALSNNAFGLAPGPIVTGWLADRIGLLGALQWLPLASMCAAIVFFIGARRSEPKIAAACVGATTAPHAT
jgi:MFS family permease